MDMMGAMSSRRPADRAVADRQPDLFDERGLIEAGRVAAPVAPDAGPAAAGLTDGALIATLPQATASNVEALCAEVVSRSLEAAAPALEELWRRFAGYGIGAPLVEQRAVLGALAQLECGAAQTTLKGIVLCAVLPASLLPCALRATADAGLALPATFVAPLLGHEDVAVREPAFALALKAGVRSDLLRDRLGDASASVRRSAALAMGKRGDAGAREALIGELGRNPSSEVIEALALVADDDVVVHLGRCAARHPALAGTVLGILRDMECVRAERLAGRLEAGRRISGSGGD